MNLRGYWTAMTLWLRAFAGTYPLITSGLSTALCAFSALLLLDPGMPLW